MRVSRHLVSIAFILIAAGFMPAHAQLGYELDIAKPKPYEQRELKAERTGDGKLKAHKRFFQNLTTHYNYFFNATNKINEVIGRAKEAHKDDYTQLLPFYNYTLDATARDQQQLDSVIYKAQTGIVMHDLRNDWIDDLYLLWGASFYLQKKFDSAHQMFQFINWAFAEKEKDGYYRYIGSRMDGNNALSIATAEKNSFLRNMVSDPPSRNNALVWLSRVYMETGQLSEAGSLIATLKNDPLFPERLNTTLEEVQAYLFYKQNMWDSSAAHLVQALDRAATSQEKARWEYLAAQMFELSGKSEEAEKYYTRSITHTTDPVMDIYARLNLVRINKEGGENYIDNNIAGLLKMARRDKYLEYRDVIYFMAAQMELQRNNFAAAQEFLLQSAKYNTANNASRNNAFLQIAGLAFMQKKYPQAASFYDSVRVDAIPPDQLAVVKERKAMLDKLIPHLQVVSRQDSLQRIAGLPEAEREAIVKKMVKQLRKAQGLDDEDAITTLPPSNQANPAAASLFGAPQRGEWYFYNDNLKSQGLVQFKQVWGNRANVDNWRRASNITGMMRGGNDPRNPRGAPNMPGASTPDASPSFATLMSRLPLTTAQIDASNDSIKTSLYASGLVYLNDMEDYPSAIATFEEIRTRFGSFDRMPELLFNLYYAYKKTGDETKAAQVKRMLNDRFPNSRQAGILNTGKDAANVRNNPEATKAYEEVYDMFLEGRFAEAREAKRRADSVYKTSTWQPQLLYIEAVYYIKEREDSTAKTILQTLMAQHPSNPLAYRAQNLIQVLGRRSQIEQELASLQVERTEDTVSRSFSPIAQGPVTAPVKRDTVANAPAKPVVTNTNKPLPAQDTANKVVSKPAPKKDTVVNRPPVVNNSPYTWNPSGRTYAVVVLKKVDKVFGNETRTAFFRYQREKMAGQTIPELQLLELDPDTKLLLIGDFASVQEAVDYWTKVKPHAPGEIIPWLKPDKYYFTVISTANLEVLKAKPELDRYQKFLEQNLPVKF
jgi:outer membrane protein assembly factor BamD (BamD/ComL family)